MIYIINNDFRNCEIPNGLTITDPPYNQNYKYNSYKDNLKENEYIQLLSEIPKPCVIIHYPEETINILPQALKIKCEQVVTWVYNTNSPKQSRLITWWGCKPDFNKIKQPYKNINDKRILNAIQKGSKGTNIYDWWEIQQVKNVSKKKTIHPCQIPEKLIKQIILTTAKKNDIIIDVFAGSGTVGKVADELGHDAYMYEIDKKYCEIIKNRTKQFFLFK